MRPWSQGPTVKKALFSLDPSQPNQAAIPSPNSKNQLEKLEKTRWDQEEVREAHAATIRNQITLDKQA